MDDKYVWVQWLAKWLALMKTTSAYNVTYKNISKNMKQMSPKFVPREWMLKMAYRTANIGNYDVMNELQTLFKTPYDEHDGEMTNKYYKKMNYKTAGTSGATSMSCSS